MASTPIIYSIYKATNKIDGKSYIGYTSKPFSQRIKQHKEHSKQFNWKFYKAINKYGWESFEWSIIYQSLDFEHCFKEMESYFIKEYDSYYTGYNETKGGDGFDSEFAVNRNKRAWSDPNSKFNSSEYRNLISERNRKFKSKEYLVTNPNGETIRIFNLRQFCRDNNLVQTKMVALASKRLETYKGWNCIKIETVAEKQHCQESP